MSALIQINARPKHRAGPLFLCQVLWSIILAPFENDWLGEMRYGELRPAPATMRFFVWWGGLGAGASALPDLRIHNTGRGQARDRSAGSGPGFLGRFRRAQ
jgi:hypothetical protein